jgi:hypothetical protein
MEIPQDYLRGVAFVCLTDEETGYRLPIATGFAFYSVVLGALRGSLGRVDLLEEERVETNKSAG